MGGKKDPVWRVVVADQRSPRDGRVIETIGHYNPQTAPSTVVLDEERARSWIARGAQPTRAVQKLMKVQVANARAAESAAETAEEDTPTAEAGHEASPEAAAETTEDVVEPEAEAGGEADTAAEAPSGEGGGDEQEAGQ